MAAKAKTVRLIDDVAGLVAGGTGAIASGYLRGTVEMKTGMEVLTTVGGTISAGYGIYKFFSLLSEMEKL